MENPTIIGFVCDHCGDMVNEKAKAITQNGTRIFPVYCAANFLPGTILDAFTKGTDIVFILACGEHDCHYFDGIAKIKRNVENLKVQISDLGLEPERLVLLIADPFDENPLVKAMEECKALVETLSPSPYKSDIHGIVEANGVKANGNGSSK